LSISGPSSRVSADRVGRIAPVVIKATQSLVADLGLHGAR
jgi:DNA-binding IclR family transcriptional regulator